MRLNDANLGAERGTHYLVAVLENRFSGRHSRFSAAPTPIFTFLPQ
jgi:hypothetical protein